MNQGMFYSGMLLSAHPAFFPTNIFYGPKDLPGIEQANFSKMPISAHNSTLFAKLGLVQA